MGSSFFGRPKMGGSSSSSPTSSSSSKRGKNKNGSDKPKQPQRGLGVAQLEKIRLHGEYNCNSFNTYPSYHPSFNHQDDVRMQAGYQSIPSSSPSFTYASSSPSSVPYGFHPNMMMNANNDQYERTTIRYGDSQPHVAPSWNPSYGILESQHFVEPNTTRHFLHEDPRNKSLGSGIQDFESSEANELDLELRL
ncbi:PREDICTED: protein SPEAR3 [Camelina sativa]|uniref:Protein SPEAR3 n=1 Tax=Camelina sativa TaxID=90675 RepID=A0ABM0UAN6_CAMSA|nr:PREDICTED: protein SPEAR3 [Camelina sativa]